MKLSAFGVMIFLFSACGFQNSSPGGGGVSESRLKQEVLDKAAGCGEYTRSVYEKNIEMLQRSSDLSSNQRLDVLRKMKDRINC